MVDRPQDEINKGMPLQAAQAGTKMDAFAGVS